MNFLAHIAPLGWEHITFNGDYIWPTVPLKDGFRPQCIIGTQISDILDVTRTRLPDHAARVSGSRLSGRMPSTS